jgi:TRAP-type C4-dicarboxylate transport system permease small subunit
MRVTESFHKVAQAMEGIGVVALLFTMVITSSDVVMGIFRSPINGAYDLAGIGSGIAISFSIAITSWKRQHITVDTITRKLPMRLQTLWNSVLRIVNIGVFALISIYLIKFSASLKQSGEVCGTIPSLPLWPIAFALACACLAQCLVAIADLVNPRREGEEHE